MYFRILSGIYLIYNAFIALFNSHSLTKVLFLLFLNKIGYELSLNIVDL